MRQKLTDLHQVVCYINFHFHVIVVHYVYPMEACFDSHCWRNNTNTTESEYANLCNEILFAYFENLIKGSCCPETQIKFLPVASKFQKTVD